MKQRLFRLVFICSICLMPISSQFNQCSGIEDPYPELEYNVKIGEKNIYQYSKFYDSRQPHPNSQLRSYIDTNGDLVTATVQVGTTFEYEIMNISEPEITIRITIEDQVSFEERRRSTIIIQTGSREKIENALNENETITVQENSITETINESSFIGDDGIFYNLDLYQQSIWDINSGWLLYQYVLVYDGDIIYFETEFKVINFQARNSTTLDENRVIRIGLLIIILVLLAFIILYPKKN